MQGGLRVQAIPLLLQLLPGHKQHNVACRLLLGRAGQQVGDLDALAVRLGVQGQLLLGRSCCEALLPGQPLEGDHLAQAVKMKGLSSSKGSAEDVCLTFSSSPISVCSSLDTSASAIGPPQSTPKASGRADIDCSTSKA